ncbi:MAG: hypothetical protein GX589_01290, partial [Deltaproteobacteria bacterium]|nr:hypothetical protein [Deltaproteobacteria bacterium]
YTFPDGLYQDFIKTGDLQSKNALKLMGENSAGAGILKHWGIGYISSREVAFIFKTYLRLIDLGEDVQNMHIMAADVALGHIDQWFVSKTAGYYKPFMVGLTLSSLIDYYEKTHDPRIPAAVAVAADGLWDCCWLGDREGASNADQGFFYTSSTLPHKAYITPLNAVIAPAYAWLYSHTGNDKYRVRGDRIFEAAVRNASKSNIGWNQKQTNQQYNYSFKFVEWRSNPKQHDPTAPAAPTRLRLTRPGAASH